MRQGSLPPKGRSLFSVESAMPILNPTRPPLVGCQIFHFGYTMRLAACPSLESVNLSLVPDALRKWCRK